MAKLTRIQAEKAILITGGAGFIGTNLADRLASENYSVLIFDNLSRDGVKFNLDWLLKKHGDKILVQIADVRDAGAVRKAVLQASHVYHLAAQVAVTTSLLDPVQDFQINTLGTLNVLEAARSCKTPPPILFTSTNKVYGKLRKFHFVENETRYIPQNRQILLNGICEDQPLDLYSPYGCSKGAADQYVLDYARIYGLPTTVFRMSCIYGPHQFGTEDQGWVAHFLISALNGNPLTIFGNGKQVRDILYVDDLVNALVATKDHTSKVQGRAFNIGGGPGNTISLMELLNLITNQTGVTVNWNYDHTRPGDQEYYVSDVSAFTRAVGWHPKKSIDQGLQGLHDWLCSREFSVRDSLRHAVI